MEKYHVIGFMPVEFTDQKSGKVIRGTSVHCTSPMSSNGYGLKSDKFFLKEEIDCSALVCDIDIYIYFNRYGKASGFQVVSGK